MRHGRRAAPRPDEAPNARRRSSGTRPRDVALWTSCFAAVLALHVAGAVYVMAPDRELFDGGPDDAVTVDLLPVVATDAAQRDDVAGPDTAETTASTSEQPTANDPDPPAPEAPPPTEVKPPDPAPPEATAPPSPAEAEAVLPPVADKPSVERTPDPRPPVDTPPDVPKDVEQRQTAPSRASEGSAALLGGGRRVSAAAEATWRGAIGAHLVRFRRYPAEARAQGLQGTARIRVTIDADGHVLGRDLVESSGRPTLDREALALMQRSDPFPRPPAGLPSPVVLSVPVKFAIQ